MRSLIIAMLVSLATIVPVTGDEHKNFRDFSSKGPEYQPLEDLRFATSELEFAGTEQIYAFGKELLASKFTTTVKVRVQTMCAVGSGGFQVYEIYPANFEIHVVQDNDRGLHDTLVRMMHDLWTGKEPCPEGHCFVFNIEGNKYAFSTTPGTELENSFYHIWVNKRLIRITFKGFQSGGGWGPLSCFTSDVLRIRLGDKEVRAYQFPILPKKFLRLYGEGFFRQ